MTRERAIHKIEFSIKAYQNLINQNVSEGKVLGDGVQGKWQADKAPIQEYQEMIDALVMAKEALKEEARVIDTLDDIMREICHQEAQDLHKWIMEEAKKKSSVKKVNYTGDGYADGHIVYDWAECPSCGRTFENGDSEWEQPFCSHCGQKLDWSFEEIEEEQP